MTKAKYIVVWDKDDERCISYLLKSAVVMVRQDADGDTVLELNNGSRFTVTASLTEIMADLDLECLK